MIDRSIEIIPGTKVIDEGYNPKIYSIYITTITNIDKIENHQLRYKDNQYPIGILYVDYANGGWDILETIYTKKNLVFLPPRIIEVAKSRLELILNDNL